MSRQESLLITQSACAMIKALGMQAENKQREALGQSMAYVEEHFISLIDEYGIGWNDVITTLSEGGKDG